MKKMINQRELIILVFLFLFMSCKDEHNLIEPEINETNYSYSVPEQINDGWETNSLSDVGFNKNKIVELMNKLKIQDHSLHSIIIVKDGKLVLEEYFSGLEIELDYQVAGSGQLKFTPKEFDRDTEHFLGSAYKSFISALIGIAIDKETIFNIDQKMFSFFPEYQEYNNIDKNNINIRQMLNMTSGLDWDDGSYPIYDPRNDEYQLLFNEEPVKFILKKNLIYLPGEKFHYNSGTTFLLSEIISRVSGLSFDIFASEVLFKPLGITQFRWAISRNEHHSIFSGGLYLRPRDMAKFGQLILNNGLWNNKRIISEEWINKMLTESIRFPYQRPPMPEMIRGYGYQWWLGQCDEELKLYCAAGWGGNFIMVLPDINITIVFTAGDYENNNFQTQFDIVINYILPAIGN